MSPLLFWRHLQREQNAIDHLIKVNVNVLEALAKRLETYSKKYGHIPCLFIDGVDLLAKDDSNAFLRLIETAKVYANSCILQIVFISSEGEIMHLRQYTSQQIIDWDPISLGFLVYVDAVSRL